MARSGGLNCQEPTFLVFLELSYVAMHLDFNIRDYRIRRTLSEHPLRATQLPKEVIPATEYLHTLASQARQRTRYACLYCDLRISLHVLFLIAQRVLES